jgi:amino acid adenylation domain-containing protein
MLIFDRISPGSTWHNVPLSFRITGPVNRDALTHAVRSTLWRHESLRTAFHADGETARAVVTETEVALAEHDLTAALTEQERGRALAALWDAQLGTPFDLSSGTLVRATLVKVTEHDHELILICHHIAVDGQSLSVLQADLLQAYRAACTGAAVPIEPSRFSEFAAWQHGFVASEQATEQLEYWRAELADLPAPAILPFMRARDSDAGSLAAQRLDFQVPDRVAEAVRALAAGQRVTPFMVMLTAFGVLLRRYTGADDLTVGMPTAGRDDPRTTNLVGYLVNMVPLRLRLAGTHTWLDTLRTVRDAALDAYENSGVPFARLAEEFDRSRSANVHPLFQIAFAAPPPLAPPSTVDGVTFTCAGGSSVESLYDIEVQVVDDGGPLRGYLKYRTALFARHHVDGLLDHLLYLTERLVADPEQRVAEIVVLRPEQRDQVVDEWNDTATGYPREATLVELVGRWVHDTPNAPAVRYGTDELTYAGLAAASDRLANYLRRKGVGAAGAESTVGVCLGFGTDWVVTALAVLKAGGAYVPLDPTYPARRLALMCQDASVNVIVVHDGLRGHIDWHQGSLVVLDSAPDRAAIAAEPATQPVAHQRPDSLAYVMYTSGSTGRPKGVGVTHRNIVRLVGNTNYLDLGPDDTIAQGSNLSFDAATFELWGALLNGARLVGVEREALLSPPRLSQTLRANGVSVMFLTTSLARQVAGTAPDTVSSLRCLLFGGEPADARMITNLLAGGGPALVNAYGPTETTAFATTHTWPAGSAPPSPDELVPIGRPIANTTVYLLDQDFQPIGPGRIGEICIGGDGVARGYVNRPDLTAERFVPNPFGAPGGRLYRTGDLGRYRPDGLIECLGRSDRQVKIRGFRIELGEIESCLRETGWVRDVSVQVSTGSDGTSMLVGYVVPNHTGASMESLRDLLADRVPAHLVPAVLIAMEALPVNENGKLDLTALPDPAVDAVTAHAEPSTPTERTVLAIWQEVLDAPNLGVHDDFFRLGGHSIKAGQVMTRIRTTLNVRAPLRLIFDNPTVALLAKELSDRLEKQR